MGGCAAHLQLSPYNAGMRILVLALVVIATQNLSASDKGYCPPPPHSTAYHSSPHASTAPPDRPNATFIGTVTVLTVVSDTGNVCSARVVDGIKDKKLNAEAAKKVGAMTFDEPARKNGRPVPTVITVQITFWRDSDGNIRSEIADGTSAENNRHTH